MLKELLLQYTDTYIYMVVDTLAKEYGWSIEYILNLPQNVVINLLKTIRLRRNLEDQLHQLNIAKGFSGKISPNLKDPFKTEKEHKEDEVKNLEKLAKTLGLKVERIK